MTRAGRIMGAMMAMGAGLNDYERSGYARPRERYERWCAMRGFGARLAGDTSPTAQERAEAKRARKTAKRRRDAERTEAGRRGAREDMRVRAIAAGSPWRLSAILAHPRWADMEWCLHVYRRGLRHDHERRRADTRRDVRGEVQP